MEMKIGIFRKVTSLVVTISMLFNSLSLPLIAVAQEVTTSPEPTELPTESPVATPTETALSTPLPEESATPTPISVIETSTPTSTPTAEPESTQVSAPATEVVVESPNNIISTQEPTPSSEPEVQGATNENAESQAPPVVETQIVDTSNPYLLTTENESWFNLITDKLDYAPTEAAVITGSNFKINSKYNLTISSSDYPPTSTTVEVTTNDLGEFSYVYQLDGTYRPNYSVEVKENGVVLATTTFTDSPSCQNDVEGVDDEPGQKDLTKMCINNDNEPASTGVSWNWDEILGGEIILTMVVVFGIQMVMEKLITRSAFQFLQTQVQMSWNTVELHCIHVEMISPIAVPKQ